MASNVISYTDLKKNHTTICDHGAYFTRVSSSLGPIRSPNFASLIGTQIKQISEALNWFELMVGRKTGEDYCTVMDRGTDQIRQTTPDPSKSKLIVSEELKKLAF